MTNLRNQRSTSRRSPAITNAFNNKKYYFTTTLAIQIRQLVNTESYRIQLAKLSYSPITDRGNLIRVANLISNETGKNELTAFVNDNYSTGSSPKMAMSDANFKTLINAIEKQYLLFEQMNSLIDVFNNTSNYFSSAQAKQLIPLVSYESNRLQLAKLSYRTITDRGNFDQLYVLLDSQSSRNKLDAYVKAYKN